MARQFFATILLSAAMLVASPLAQPVSDDFTLASTYGVAATASPSDNRAGLQAAMNDIALGRAPATLLLPRGEINLSGDLILRSLKGEQASSRLQVIIRGVGAGENGSWLHFASGSMRIHAANHVLEDFRITSDDADALVIEALEDGKAPSRSVLRNIRAENSAGSGIVISGSWIHLFENVFSRFNDGWGIEGRADKKFGISANALTIVGGELQGNGSVQGARSKSGGSKAGSGGGLSTGPLVQLSVTGTTIEGNLGDGVFISEGATNVGLYNVYFEKNGSHPANRDIGNAPPSRPGFGPASVIISGSNFTANKRNGEAQRHAIELWNARGLLIKAPVFFGSKAVAYTAEPIAIRETAGGISRGWVELPEYRWSGYHQEFVLNRTLLYGFPRKAYFSSNRVLGSNPFQARVPLSPMAGRRVELISLYDSVGFAKVETRFGRGPNGAVSAVREDEIAPIAAQRQTRLEHRTNLPEGSPDFVQVVITGTQGSSQLHLISTEVTTYEPVLRN